VTDEAGSVDANEVANNFIPDFKKIVEEEGYSPKQVFNGDEAGHFWKSMPDRTYNAQEEKTPPGFKASKD
jgi:predicted RNA-binding protein with RPS1 domain